MSQNLESRGESPDSRPGIWFTDAELEQMRADRFAAALDYARRDWMVLRLYGVSPDGKGGLVCDCYKGAACGKDSGKHPNVGGEWQKKATSDEATIRKWWKENPNSNVGIMPSGNFDIVVDIDFPDPKKPWERDGFDEWDELEEHFGKAPETLTVRTGSGAVHKYFKQTGGGHIGNALPAFSGTDVNAHRKRQHP